MKAYKVTEINTYINKTLSNDLLLADVKIEGEISNFVHHHSGHMYFNLKDENSKIKCVMFKSYNKSLELDIKEGMKIIARGNIAVYERDGVYQLYVKAMEEEGLGQLYREFEKLKTRLDQEGLFDPIHKQALPREPKKIGIVTSATGAAVRDIITVIRRRFPATNLLIYPSLVQGKEAATSIIKGLTYLDQREDVDLIIFGRGGGSMEELFAFNDEDLARTIFALKTPSISAVGHEIDFTIGDFVADLRAATPSAAAELSVPDYKAYLVDLKNTYSHISTRFYQGLTFRKNQLELRHRDIRLNNPYQLILNSKQDLDNIYRDYRDLIYSIQSAKKQELLALKSRLDLSKPTLALEKGYGLITSMEGETLSSVKNFKQGQEVRIILKDGEIISTVKSIMGEDSND